MYVNLTSRPIRLLDHGLLPPSPSPVRIHGRGNDLVPIDILSPGVHLVVPEALEIVGLPEPADGVWYIADATVASLAADLGRWDVLAACRRTAVTGEHGELVYRDLILFERDVRVVPATDSPHLAFSPEAPCQS